MIALMSPTPRRKSLPASRRRRHQANPQSVARSSTQTRSASVCAVGLFCSPEGHTRLEQGEAVLVGRDLTRDVLPRSSLALLE